MINDRGTARGPGLRHKVVRANESVFSFSFGVLGSRFSSKAA